MEYETKIQRSEAASSVGLDLGVNKLVTLSNGDYFAPVNSYKQLQDKLLLPELMAEELYSFALKEGNISKNILEEARHKKLKEKGGFETFLVWKITDY